MPTKTKQKNDLVREFYLIVSSNSVWNKWKEVFEKHETRELIGMVVNKTTSSKQIKSFVNEILSNVAGSQRDKDGESNIHIPRFANYIEILESYQYYLHKTENLMCILVLDEEMVGQHEVEDNHCTRAQQAHAPHKPCYQHGSELGKLESFKKGVQVH